MQSGPYRLVRHPIYTALLLLAGGWTVARGGRVSVAGTLLLAGLLRHKAGIEDTALAELHPTTLRTGRAPGRSCRACPRAERSLKVPPASRRLSSRMHLPPHAIRPDYAGGSILNLAATLGAHHGVPTHHAPYRHLLPLDGARHVVLIVVDALGAGQFRQPSRAGTRPPWRP